MPRSWSTVTTSAFHKESLRQRALNRQTAGAWQSYAGHRQHVTTLLVAGEPGTRLCVLGAGNCNDLDLGTLATFYRSVTLVDLDTESVVSAVSRQSHGVRAQLDVRAPIDVALPGALHPLRNDYDVVCSAGLLSQLIDSVARRELDLDAVVDEVKRVRAAHLSSMLDLLRPGGRGLLVTEMVSSDTAPQLTKTPVNALPQLMAQLATERNFFTGLNPFAIDLLLRKNPALARRISRTAFHPPWLWQLGPARSYLAYALSFQRA